MKKILLFITTILLSILTVNASDIDTSIIDKLDESKIKELNIDFRLKTFKSCENLESVMGKYIKDYYKNNYKNSQKPNIYYDSTGMPLVNLMMPKSTVINRRMETNFSETNSQVVGVKESDIIKTDGKYVYYYNVSQKMIYIIDAYGTEDIKILKKIALPKGFRNIVLYIGNNKLTILAEKYSNTNFKRNYYINRKVKTYTIIYDITSKTSPKLEKLYINDGKLRKSRKIGKYVYIISNNSFEVPYHTFKSIEDIKINVNNIIPKKLELSRVSDKSDQNFKLKGKKLPFNIKAGNIARCSEIEYSLPDADTLKKFSFDPSYNIISIINTEDSSEKVKTKIIAGSNSEIYMSLNNLYLIDNIYKNYTYKCSNNNFCIMPYYYGNTTNTLIHKINILENNLKYQNSTLVPGKSLNQYSMDEKDSKFRIITSISDWNKDSKYHTNLYILDKNLKLYSSLKNLGKNEDFKSARFIGDKLFLVTFENIDPLFVIDLINQKKPKILGELKMPGYSEYLHPYDENHLIGLGRDTFKNSYGSIQNGGLKIDLYEINYNKKCGDSNLSDEEKEKCKSGDYKGIIIKQKYSKVLGGIQSSSEAEKNPRMFMWHEDKKLLFLPATIYTNSTKTSYIVKDFFQGLITLKIDKDSGITEKYRISHLNYSDIGKKRLEECKKYFVPNSKKEECKKLINGSTYCLPVRKKYVPQYCYSDYTLGRYIAGRKWNLKKSFVKRALWIGNSVYSISDKKIIKSNINTGKEENQVEMK